MFLIFQKIKGEIIWSNKAFIKIQVVQEWYVLVSTRRLTKRSMWELNDHPTPTPYQMLLCPFLNIFLKQTKSSVQYFISNGVIDNCIWEGWAATKTPVFVSKEEKIGGNVAKVSSNTTIACLILQTQLKSPNLILVFLYSKSKSMKLIEYITNNRQLNKMVVTRNIGGKWLIIFANFLKVL